MSWWNSPLLLPAAAAAVAIVWSAIAFVVGYVIGHGVTLRNQQRPRPAADKHTLPAPGGYPDRGQL